MNFGEALQALKEKHRVQRSGWNEKGMWLILVVQGESTEIANGGLVDLGELGLWAVSPYVGMKTADEKFVPWLASQTDILAEDWQIVN